MQIDISADDVTLLMAALPLAAREPGSGFVYNEPLLTVPPAFASQVEALLQTPAGVQKAALAAYARDRRWQVEVGGITIAGAPVATDDRSKMMIIGARMAAEAAPSWTTIWQGADGGAYPLDAAAMIAISDAVQAHVNGTFATLAGILADIDTGDITTRDEIDTAFLVNG